MSLGRNKIIDSTWISSTCEKESKCLWNQRDQRKAYNRMDFFERNDRFSENSDEFIRIGRSSPVNGRPSTAVRRHVKKISEEFSITQTKFENSVKSSGILIHIESSDPKKNSGHSGALNTIFSPKTTRNSRQIIRKMTLCTKCGPENHDVMPLVSPPPIRSSHKSLRIPGSSGKEARFSSSASSRKCLSESNKRCSLSLSPSSPNLREHEHVNLSRASRRRKSQSANAGLTGGILKIPFEQVKKSKLFTENAVREGKVFSIHGGFPAVREAMLKRGWVEKVIYAFPYVNPHPQNCVCSHVGWQISGLHNHTSIESTCHPHSVTSSPSSVPSSSSSTCSSSVVTTSSLSSSNSLPDASNEKLSGHRSDHKPSASSPTITAEPDANVVVMCDTVINRDISQPMTEDGLQQNDKYTTLLPLIENDYLEITTDIKEDIINDNELNVFEKKTANKYMEMITKTINPSALGANEIRDGLYKSINSKNLPIFQYSVPIYERKRKSSCDTLDSDTKSSKTDDENKDEVPILDDVSNENKNGGSLVEKNTVDAVELGPVKKPFNPYPVLDYILTEQDKPVIARVLRNMEPNLIWSWNRDSISYKHLSKEQLVNRFPNTPFTTKFGLCETLQQLHWFSEAPSVDSFVPRAYCIGQEDERTAFTHDYRTTACLSLLKWIAEGSNSKGSHAVAHPLGEVPIRRIRQALQHVERFIQSCCHDDLDAPPLPPIRESEWEALLTAHHRIIHQGRKVKAPQHHVEALLRDCRSAIERVEPYWPQIHMDGNRNVWIVKPGAQSRGRGIFLLNHLDEILALVQSPLIYQTKYVVQKYMERPLLVHNTKFDIRQWFLVTDWNPLTLWMYKESYLRFCSQQYDMSNNDESIHLSNNAIQIKYVNGVRDEDLPEDNMWDCRKFKEYLRSKGHSNSYDEIIYPGMKDALISTMLAAQVQMDSFKHGFEFFGADFMLTEDLRPWLIEINSSPCMASTTNVTKRMCYESLHDTIKVVIDYRQNKTADTGNFELIYQDKEKSVANLPYVGVTMQVVGRQIWRGPAKHEKRKPVRKTKSVPKVVKSIPLITLKLEDSGDVRPAKSYPLLNCENYGPAISAIVVDSPSESSDSSNSLEQ